MPIRFHCKRCDQLLGISSRKAGARIECPKCGFAQEVPSEDAAAAVAAMSQFVHKPAETDQFDFVVYDDQPAAIEMPRPQSDPNKPTPPPVAAQPVARSPEPPAVESTPSQKILFPRWVIYAQGILFLVLAAAAFAAGYVIGRGRPPLELPPVVTQQAPPQSVLLEGKLVYNPGTGRIAGDQNALIMVLPADRVPEKPFSVEGIRSADPPPLASHPSLQTIQQLGGAYARADQEGNFTVLLPEEGEYYLLLVSHNVHVAANRKLDADQLSTMGQYFRDPARLIDRFQYLWAKHTLGVDAGPVEVDFGRTVREP